MDPNARDRLLLQSSAPSLYASVDCYALVAAIVSRQTNVVRLLLQVNYIYVCLQLIHMVYISCNGVEDMTVSHWHQTNRLE